ncbi:Prefoldin beta-like protein [Linnemannia elongata]|nr:Prefoldin beta-like protein [Linnemannia elongata]
MRMLEKDEEEGDIQVSWQDQENINTFSKYNAKLQDLEEAYESKKTEKEYLDDLAMELELADEDEPVKYRIGEAFVSLSLEAAQERISKSQEELDQEIEGLKAQMDEAVEKMDGLKKVLYARFGNAINLEKD